MAVLKQRTPEQLKEKKIVHRKHGQKYMALGMNVSEQRAKRMLCYTALITKAIATITEHRGD